MRNFWIVLVFLTLCLNAQPPKRFYTKFGGSGVDIGYGVKQTLDKQYILIGSTSSSGLGNTDFVLMKIDSMGQILWQKNYGGFNNDVGRSVIQLSDSGYVMTGYSNSFGNGGYDILTIRTDKAGNVIWQASFGGEDWEFGYNLVQGGDGNIYVCGSTYSYGNGKQDGCIVKYDLTGVKIWEKFFGSSEDDDLKAIIRTNDNNLAAVGRNSIYDINGDSYFVKLNNNGDTLFTKYFGGKFKDYANDLVQKPDSSYIIGGAKSNSLTAKTKSIMYSIKKNGVSNWVDSAYYGPNDEAWVSLANSKQDSTYTGYIKNYAKAPFGEQGVVFIHKPNTFPIKVNEFGGFEGETVYDIEATKDSGFVVVGVTESFGAQNGDIFFMKLHIEKDSMIFRYDNIIGLKEEFISFSEGKFIIKNLGNNIYQVESSDWQVETLVLTNTFGNTIYRSDKIVQEGTVNLNSYPNSLYVLTVISDKGQRRNFKLIKNN